LHEVSGKRDHRARQDAPVDVKYGPAHAVRLAPGGVLARLAAAPGLDPAQIMVNSLHGQAIDRLANRLVIEAESEDGVIEAVRVADAPAFAIGVQWHAEYKLRENPFALALFEAFGDACRARAARQVRPGTLSSQAAE
jgi:putative glutamine amidotransferase